MKIGKFSVSANITNSSLAVAIGRGETPHCEKFVAWFILSKPSDRLPVYAGISRGKWGVNFASRSVSFHNNEYGRNWNFSK